MDTFTVPLEMSRFQRVEKLQTLLYFPFGFALITGGFDHIRAGGLARILLGGLGIACGMMLFFLIVFTWRRLSARERITLGWLEAFAGLVLLAQALTRPHPGTGFHPSYAGICLGLATLAQGVFAARLGARRARRRAIHFNPLGFSARMSRFHHLDLTWKSLQRVRASERVIEFETGEGRAHRINLKGVDNRTEVLAAFLAQASQNGIPVEGA